LEVIELLNVTFGDIKRSDLTKSIAMVVISPFEIHGEFLPLGQDVLWARVQQELLTELLLPVGYKIYKYPEIVLGTNVLHGNYGFEIGVLSLRKILINTIKTLHFLGFRKVIICNGQGGPLHSVAIYSAQQYAQKIGVQCFSTLQVSIKRGLQDNWKLKGIDLRQDLHAGLIEVSIALARYPELVNSAYIKYKFSEINPSLLTKILVMLAVPIIQPIFQRLGFGFAKESWIVLLNWYLEGQRPDYIGYPDLADKQTGELLLQNLKSCFQEDIVAKLV